MSIWSVAGGREKGSETRSTSHFHSILGRVHLLALSPWSSRGILSGRHVTLTHWLTLPLSPVALSALCSDAELSSSGRQMQMCWLHLHTLVLAGTRPGCCSFFCFLAVKLLITSH